MPRLASSVLRACSAVLALLCVAVPGRAQAPRAPAEFYATIAVVGFERPLEVRQSGLKRRVEVASGAVAQTFVSDRTRGALIVMTAAGRRRLAFYFPLAQQEGAAPLPLDMSLIQGSTRLTRIGGSTVAGRSCALWRYVGYLGRNGAVCASPEGVILQLTPDGRRAPLFQVTSIVFARQDQRWFAPGPDYQIAVLPGAGGVSTRPLPPAPPAKR